MDSDLARLQATEAERLSASSPHQARQLAESVRRDARTHRDQLALVISERALGLAARELNDLPRARRHLRRSIVLAEKAGLDDEAAATRSRLAYVLSLGGDTDSAFAGLEASRVVLAKGSTAQLQMERALVLQRAGDIEEALRQYRMAIPALRRTGNHLDEARARSNRAVLHTYRGNYSAAEADLRRAEELAPLAGAGFATAKIHHNFGFVAAYRGNVPEALAWFDQAQEEFAVLGQSEAPVLSDRCETLLSVGLASEGLEAALRAVKVLEQGGSSLDLAEARLMAARAALLAGEISTATTSARQARGEFRKQQRKAWEVLANYVIAKARLTQDRSKVPSDLIGLADELESAGWLSAALELRIAWSIDAMAKGATRAAKNQLALVSRFRRQRTAVNRGHGWHAEALLREAEGDIAGCRAALRAGLRELDRHHAALGATELQAHAAGQAKELAILGCRLAVAQGKPTGVLEWAERWRAGALRKRPVHPPRNREVERLLAELRHLGGEIASAVHEGRPTEKFLRRQGSLESAIKDSTRRAPGGTGVPATDPPTARELRGALGDRTLVEFLAIDEQLFALTVTARRTRLHEVCAMGEVLRELDSLRFSYSRLARGRGAAHILSTFAAAADHAARRIDSLLFSSIADELGPGSLVIVPTGRLHHLPWAGLVTCSGRTVSVAPSAAAWIAATRRTSSRRRARIVLVAGPDVPHADSEIRNLHKIYPRASVLSGAEATTEHVANALDGADLVHIAAHGNFRSDNPLFSSLQLSDGHLTVYDLELLHKAPDVVVLSACDSGLNAVRPGDELLGFSAAVLSLGTRNLVASVVPVPDITTALFMVAVHQHLANNESPAKALANARDAMTAPSQAELVTTAAFVCFGA